ncbi:hypothetical protein [Natrialba asiatica]|uniref:Uncharacterized protein n=1 Tax=Natrialba asiatica (strain ATCC 700177 / DSM 12278 / JCM 9576 / FERM P-10747 / NBRC 102637 / 172P1) TaxID=29540 RepID=M0AWX8_NATA1|nr:hypothetical protein [Natrialba asiatica]ELZ02832.1 hypothetical protein C481_06497 [Natrialba asiatica DSM 12278]
MADGDTSADHDAGSNSDAETTTPTADTDAPPFRIVLNSVDEWLASLECSVREIEAAVAGGLAGGFQAALVLQLYDTDAIRRIGGGFGSPTLDGGWLAMFALGVLFALPFSLVVSRSIDSFVGTVMALSSRNESLRRLLTPLLKRSALATTTFALGNGYGIVVGAVSSLFLVPGWLPVAMGASTPFSNVTVAGVVGVLAWAIYGGTLGLVYGLILES